MTKSWTRSPFTGTCLDLPVVVLIYQSLLHFDSINSGLPWYIQLLMRIVGFCCDLPALVACCPAFPHHYCRLSLGKSQQIPTPSSALLEGLWWVQAMGCTRAVHPYQLLSLFTQTGAWTEVQHVYSVSTKHQHLPTFTQTGCKLSQLIALCPTLSYLDATCHILFNLVSLNQRWLQ